MSYSNVFKSYQTKAFALPHQTNNQLKTDLLPMTVLADEIFGMDVENATMAIADDTDSYAMRAEKSYYLDPDAEQLELPLENPNSLLKHYRKMIVRYEKAYERMAMLAMKWYYLEHDAERDEVIGKMLRDIQVYRKLSGYKLV